jgi:alpha-galactosidase
MSARVISSSSSSLTFSSLTLWLTLAWALAACGGGKSPPVVVTPPPPTPDVDSDLPAQPIAGAAPTPPMGWNSWNTFKQNITDPLFRQMADAMVASGMQDAGYRYINIDDTWSTKDPAPDFARGADEPLVPDIRKFASGMPALADYIHGQGLKLGIYADRGVVTCGSFPGSAGHETQDAATFANWGVDYVKYDNCPPTDDTTCDAVQGAYTAMGAALVGAGRSMVYSLCAWNFCEWGLPIGSLWRTTKDITPDRASFLSNLATNDGYAAFAGPNGWNDPDMLEVGNFVPTPEEETPTVLADYRAHFTLWSIAAAPLITGNDLRHMTPAVTQILTNKEVIALDQDALGYQGIPVWTAGDLTVQSIWAKPLNQSGARGVVLFNGTDAPADLTFDLPMIGLRGGPATARDLWAHQDLPPFQDTLTATVPAHDVVALRVLGVEPVKPTGKAFLSDLPWIYAANRLGAVDRDQSNSASGAAPIMLRGTAYTKGLGLAAPSSVVFRLGQACTRFSATVGVDDKAKGHGSVGVQVWADGIKLFDSATVAPALTGLSDPLPIQLDVTGKHRLKLLVTNAGDGNSFDYLDFADAQLDCK